MTTATTPGPTIIRARDAEAFLGAVPRLAGFVPRDSLVLVPLTGSRAHGVLRVDLPGPSADLAQLAATIVGALCRVTGVDRVAVIAYDTGAAWPPDGPLPREALIERVVDRAHACDLEVTGAYLVCADGWGAYGDRAAPHPLARIAPEGDVAADQHAGISLPRAAKTFRRRVAGRLATWERRVEALLAPDAVAEASEARGPAALDVARLPDLWEDVLGTEPDRLDAGDAALLALSFATPLLRDALLTQWSTDLAGGRTILAWQLAWRPTSAAARLPRPEGPLRMAGEGPRPDAARLRRGLALARRVAANAPTRAQAGALATCGWLAWALGNGTHAGAYADRARALEPRHGLAGIVASLADGGRLPAWAFALPEEEG